MRNEASQGVKGVELLSSLLAQGLTGMISFAIFLYTGIWHLVSGIWHLVSGIWHLASGIWRLVTGDW